MNKQEHLKIIREQLIVAIAFMRDTPDPFHSTVWWAADMPAFPDIYDPDDWNEQNDPVSCLWKRYLVELCGDCIMLDRPEMEEYYKKALELPIADLLAAEGPEEENNA